MKHIKKYLLAVFAMILLLVLCACNTLPTGTTGGESTNGSDPIEALKNFDQGSKIYVKVDEGNAWYVDYAALSNSDGDKVSEIFAGAMNYAEIDLNKYSITVDGKTATADTIVKAGGKVIVTSKTPETLELKEGEFKVAFELYDPNSGREQGMYFACTPNTALKNFFEANITEGRQTYDDFVKDYDMYVGGEKADGGTVLTADAYIFGYYTKKVENGGNNSDNSGNSGNNGAIEDKTITVELDCTYADGENEKNTVSVIAANGMITLDDFIKQYTRLDSFAASSLRGTWTLDGKTVIDGNIELSDGSVLTYIQRIDAHKNIVTLRVVYSDGWDEESVEVEGKSLTLRDFVEKYADPGCSFEDSLNTVHWTYNGKAADASTVIEADTTVFAIRNDAEVAEPDEGEVKIGIIVIETAIGMKRGMDLIVPEGEYTLESFFETYVTNEPGSFKDAAERFDWYVDGAPATADSKITASSVITAVMTEDPASPDDPLPSVSMSVDVSILIGNMSYYMTATVPAESIRLEDLHAFYIQPNMGNNVTVNGSFGSLTAGTTSGTLSGTVSGTTSDGNVTIGSYTISLGLYAFTQMDFSKTMEMGIWTVNGVKADGDTLVKDGDQVAYTAESSGSGDEDKDEINVIFRVLYDMGNGMGGYDDYEFQIPAGIDFKTFVDDYGDVWYDDSLAYRTWYVNGEPVDQYYILAEGDIVTYAEIDYINIYYFTMTGNTWTQIAYIVPDVSEITLGEFFSEYLSNGGDINDTLTEYQWLVDDIEATADTVLTDFSTVSVISLSEPPVEPDTGEYVYYLNFYYSGNISFGANIILTDESIVLGKLYDIYCDMNGGSEYSFYDFEWYVDFESAERDTIVVAEQYIMAYLRDDADDDNGSGDLVPDDSFFEIKLEYLTLNGYGYATNHMIYGYTELELGKLFDLYLHDIYGGNYDDYTWSVDYKSVEADFMIRDGMTVTMQVKESDVAPVEKFYVLVTLTDHTGTTYFGTEYYIEGTCITLYDFYVAYLRDDLGFAFDDFGWQVNGYQVADGKEALLIEGDKIVMTYPGLWGSDVTKSFQVLFTYIDANGDEFTNRYEISGYADLEIEKFFKLYLSMSYAGNASDYTWTVDGETVGVDFILTDKVTVTMQAKDETLQPPVTEIEVTVVVVDGEGKEEVTTAVPAGTTVAEMLLELLGSDAETLEVYFVFDINGERVDIYTVLQDKDVLTLTSRFETTPGEGEITVYFQETLDDGEKIPYVISAGSTLYDCLMLMGVPEDYLKTSDFYINGTLTGINTVLYDGDVIVMVIGEEVDPPVQDYMHVSVTKANSGEWLQAYQMPVGATVADLLEMLGEDADLFFEKYYIYYNGEKLSLKDVLYDQTTIEFVLQEDDAKMMNAVILNDAGEMYIRIPQDATVYYIALHYANVGPDTIFAYFNFYRDGELLSADSVINAGDKITMSMKDDTVEPSDATITVELYDGQNHVKQDITISGTSITLRELYEKYISGESFDHTIGVIEWTLSDGTVIDGDYTLKSYDHVIGTPIGEEVDPPVEAEYLVTVEMYYADGVLMQSIPVYMSESSIILSDFTLKYTDGEYELTRKYGTWYLNDKEATAETVISSGDVLVFVSYESSSGETEGETITVTLNMAANEYNDAQAISLPIAAGSTVYDLLYSIAGDEALSMLQSYHFYFEGEYVQADLVLSNGDVLDMVLDTNMNSEITVYYQGAYSLLLPGCNFYIPEDITVADFFNAELDGYVTYEEIASEYTVYINGKEATAATIIEEGDVIAIVPINEENYWAVETITVTIVDITSDSKEEYTLPAGATLWYYLEYDWGNPGDHLAELAFYRDNGRLDAMSPLYDGDVISIEASIADGVIEVIVIIDDEEMEYCTVPSGYTIIDLLNLYMIDGIGSFGGVDAFVADYNCYRNGVLMDINEVLYDQDIVEIYLKSNDEDMITICLVTEAGYKSEVRIPAGSTLLYVAERYGDGTGESVFTYVNFYRDDELLTPDAIMYDGDVLFMVAIVTDSCNHSWDSSGGYCYQCGEPCPEYDAHFDAYLYTSCPTCGYSTNGGAMQYTTVYMIQNGEEFSYIFQTNPGTYPTIDDVLMEVFGQDLAMMHENYATILYEGMEVTDGSYQVTGGSIEVLWEVIDLPPEIVEPVVQYQFWVCRYYALDSETDEAGNLINNEWWYNVQSNSGWIDGEFTLRGMIEYSGIEIDDSCAVFVNGERVYDLDSYFTISETMYITLIDEQIAFQGINVTVYNNVTGEESVHYVEAPLYCDEIISRILADIDTALYTYSIYPIANGTELGWHDDWSSYATDVRIVLDERINYISADVVDADGNISSKNFEIAGAMPTASAFVNAYIGNFDDYRVFDIGGGMLMELGAEDIIPYSYFVVIPKALIKDSITVTYDLTIAYGDCFQGTLTVASPVLLYNAFENAEFSAEEIWWNEYMYEICVNGVALTDDKGAYYTLLWQDVTVTVLPSYTFELMVNNIGDFPYMGSVTVTDPDTTFAELLALFGIDADLVNIDYALTDTVGMYYQYGWNWFYISYKTVPMTVTLVDTYGNANSCYVEVPTPITMEMLIQYLMQNGCYFENGIENYICTCYDSVSGETLEISGNYVFKYSEGASYELYFEPIFICVNVEVIDLNGNYINSHWYTVIEREWTLVQVAEMLGYSVDDVIRFATTFADDVDGESTLNAGETLYIYLNCFSINVYVYGASDGDGYYYLDNLSGGLTVSDILSWLGYDWSIVSEAILDTYSGSMQVSADTVIKEGYALYFYCVSEEEYLVYFNVANSDGEMIYGNELYLQGQVSVTDLLSMCGFSWDQVSYGYYSEGEISMDTVITHEDKIMVYLIADEGSVINVVVLDHQGNQIDWYEFSYTGTISVDEVLSDCGYYWDAVETVYSQAFGSTVTAEVMIAQTDTLEIHLLPRELPIFIRIIDSNYITVYECEIYVQENIVYYAPTLLEQLGYSWDQLDYGYYSGGSITENSLIGAEDSVEFHLNFAVESVDAAA